MTGDYFSRYTPDAGARPQFSVSGERGIESSVASGRTGPLQSEAAAILSSPEGRAYSVARAETVDFAPVALPFFNDRDLVVTPINQVYGDTCRPDGGRARPEGRTERLNEERTRPEGDAALVRPEPREDLYFGPERNRRSFSEGQSAVDLVRSRFLEKLGDFTNPPGEKPPDVRIAYENLDQRARGPRPDYYIDRSGMVHPLSNGAQRDGHIVIEVQRPQDLVGNPTRAQQVMIDGLVEYTARAIQSKYSQKLPDIRTRDGKVDQVTIRDHQNLVSDFVEQKFGNKLPPERQVSGQPPMPDVPPGVNGLTDTVARSRGSGGTTTIPREMLDRQIPRQDRFAQDVVPPIAAMENTAAAMFNPHRGSPYDTVKLRPGIGYQVGRYGLNEGLVGGWIEGCLSPELNSLLGHPPDWRKLGRALKDNPELRTDFRQCMKEALEQRAGMLRGEPGMEDSAKRLREFARKFDSDRFVQNFGNFVSKLGGQNGKVSAGEMRQYLPKELQEVVAKDYTEYFTREVMRQRGVPDANPDQMTARDAGRVALAWFLGRMPEQGSPDWNNPNYQDYMRRGQDFYRLARAGQFGDRDITIENGSILAAAGSSVGRRMWAENPTGSWTQNGRLGCAASVVEVLKRAGVHLKDTALAANLAHQLVDKLGWERIPATLENMRRHAGAVIFGTRNGWNDFRGGGSAHIGIVGENVNGRPWIYDNSSSSRRWEHRPVDRTSFTPGNRRFGPNMWLLVPPDARRS